MRPWYQAWLRKSSLLSCSSSSSSFFSFSGLLSITCLSLENCNKRLKASTVPSLVINILPGLWLPSYDLHWNAGAAFSRLAWLCSPGCLQSPALCEITCDCSTPHGTEHSVLPVHQTHSDTPTKSLLLLPLSNKNSNYIQKYGAGPKCPAPLFFLLIKLPF